ncbi:MAG: hypothetical protein IJZ59_04305 [Alphaproteobacteria bacterium]|nr:hypothetical protein [Alphaproteobacteria bacterium]
MKKFYVVCSALLIAYSVAEAKPRMADNYVSQYMQTAIYQIAQYDKDDDGRLSPEEFGAKDTRKLTRDDRRQIRKAKKEGIYQNSTDQFATIDENADGFLTVKELEKYIKNQSERTKGKVRYY